MRHAHPLGLEPLEGRTLLSRVPHALAHPSAPAAVPLAISGTLTVNNKPVATITNGDGSVTTSVPVAGTLGKLGAVRGVWTESGGQFGENLGPDTIQLRTPQGSFVVAFNNLNAVKGERAPDGS